MESESRPTDRLPEALPSETRLSEAKEQWTKPREQTIPRPTYAPAVIAIAIVCLLWGFVTTFLISLLGVILFVAGLADWIGELRHERE